MVKFYEMTEKTDMPQEILDVLDDDFFAKINVENQPPIFLKELKSGAMGFCAVEDNTTLGEINIDPVLLRLPNHFKSMYLHEMSHRILGCDYGHKAEFFCLNLCLHIRAELGEWVNFYDIQDEKVEMLPSIFSLVLPLAQQLANSNLTAEQCSQEIIKGISIDSINKKHNEPAKLKSKIIELEEIIKNAKYVAWQNYALLSGFGVLAWALK